MSRHLETLDKKNGKFSLLEIALEKSTTMQRIYSLFLLTTDLFENQFLNCKKNNRKGLTKLSKSFPLLLTKWQFTRCAAREKCGKLKK